MRLQCEKIRSCVCSSPHVTSTQWAPLKLSLRATLEMRREHFRNEKRAGPGVSCRTEESRTYCEISEKNVDMISSVPRFCLGHNPPI